MDKLMHVEPSFMEYLRKEHPEMLPDIEIRGAGEAGDYEKTLTEGTTIIALTYKGGVIIGGDRRATAGHRIARTDSRKVHPVDGYSAIATSGTVGPCREMTSIIRTEVELYERLEGRMLSLEGKANAISMMVRMNFLRAVRLGLVAIPIFAGYDPSKDEGRIYSYDITGAKYVDTDFYSTGSGGQLARGTLKREWKPELRKHEAIDILVEALFEASDEDAATGRPGDPTPPLAYSITKKGLEEIAAKTMEGASLRIKFRRQRGERK